MHMSKKKRASANSAISRQKRAIKQKRGLGRGREYQAFIQVRKHDFGSHGRSHIWRSPLDLYVSHHLLSDLERFTILQAAAAGAECRAQYPLIRDGVEDEFSLRAFKAGSMSIAKDLGIKHPHLGGDEEKILTTDLLLRFRPNNYIAIYVKNHDQLPVRGSRGWDLLRIERTYWRRRSVMFLIVTDKTVKINAVIHWLDWASSFKLTDYWAGVLPDEEKVYGVVNMILATDSRRSMYDRLSELDLPLEEAVTFLKFCLWTGELKVDYLRAPQADLAWPWVLAPKRSRSVPSLIVLPELRRLMRTDE